MKYCGDWIKEGLEHPYLENNWDSDKFLEDNLEGWMGGMREAKSLTGRATPRSPAMLTENEIPVKTLNMSHLLNGILLFIITFH